MTIPAFRSFVPFPGIMAAAGGSGVSVSVPVAIVAQVAADSGSGSTGLTLTWPAGIQPNDLLILMLAATYATTNTVSDGPSAGFVEIDSVVTSNKTTGTAPIRNVRMWLWRKIAVGTESGTGETLDTTALSEGAVGIVLRNVDIDTLAGTTEATGSTFGSTDDVGNERGTAPSLTASGPGRLAVLFWAQSEDSTSGQMPAPGNWTEGSGTDYTLGASYNTSVGSDRMGAVLTATMADGETISGKRQPAGTYTISHGWVARGLVVVPAVVAPATALWSWPAASDLGPSSVRTVTPQPAVGFWDRYRQPHSAISDGSTVRIFYGGYDVQAAGYAEQQALGQASTTDPTIGTGWTTPGSAAATFLPGGAGATQEEGYFQLAVARDSASTNFVCVFGGADWTGGTPAVDTSVCRQTSTTSVGTAWTPNNAASKLTVIPARSTLWAGGSTTTQFWPASIWYDATSDRWHMLYETSGWTRLYHVQTTANGETPANFVAANSSLIWDLSTTAAGLGLVSTSELSGSCIVDRGNAFVDIVTTVINAPSYTEYRVVRIPVSNPIRTAAWTAADLGTAVVLYQFGTGVTNGIGEIPANQGGGWGWAEARNPCIHTHLGTRYLIWPFLANATSYDQVLRYFITQV